MAVDSKKPADTGGGGERKRLDAPDFIYISGFSEERLRLREFVRSRWLSGFIYLVHPIPSSKTPQRLTAAHLLSF